MQTLKYQSQEGAPDDDFKKEKFAWVVLPEFHLVQPLVAFCYTPATMRFRVVMDLTRERWLPKIRFSGTPRRVSGYDIRKTMDDIALVIYDDPSVRGTFWLADEKIKDDGLPVRWLEFEGQYLDGLSYMEPGATILRDSSLEAVCDIILKSPIRQCGNWPGNVVEAAKKSRAPLSFGEKLVGAAKLCGYVAADAVKTWSKKAEENRQLGARQGSFYSYMPYPVLFDQIACQLAEPIGRHVFSVSADRQLMQMAACTSWRDYACQGVPEMPQRLDLRLQFVPEQSGTRVHFEWMHYYQFSPGITTDQLIHIVNGWIKHIAESAPPPEFDQEETEEETEEIANTEEPASQIRPQPQEQERQPLSKPHPLAPSANFCAAVKTAKTTKKSQPKTDSSDWDQEIRIAWPTESGYDDCVFTPQSPLQELRRLAYVYEQNDTYCHSFMNDDDYARLKSWIVTLEAAS